MAVVGMEKVYLVCWACQNTLSRSPINLLHPNINHVFFFYNENRVQNQTYKKQKTNYD
jgi:hypothetical protein